MKGWDLVISSCPTLSSSIFFHSDTCRSSGTKRRSLGNKCLRKKRLSLVPLPLEENRRPKRKPFFLHLRKQTVSSISSWLHMAFKIPRPQIPATRHVNTSPPLPSVKLGQWFSNFGIRIAWNACWNTFLGPIHRTPDSVPLDEVQNVAVLSSFTRWRGCCCLTGATLCKTGCGGAVQLFDLRWIAALLWLKTLRTLSGIFLSASAFKIELGSTF